MSEQSSASQAPWGLVAIVGVGLIGGSIGLALRQRKLAKKVMGIGRTASVLKRAEQLGAIDAGVTDLATGVADADLVVVCTPVDSIAPQVIEIAALCRASAVVTDAGSTKLSIVKAIESHTPRPRFIGSHPLAGSEKSGVEHAQADLFNGRVTLVTPTRKTAASDVEAVCNFWAALGSLVMQMSPVAHDRALANTSHLPHLLASVLAASTARQDLPLVAGGWRDTTRVAAGDAGLWRQILLDNGDNVLKSLTHFEKKLAAFRGAIEQRNGSRLEKLLRDAIEIRSAVTSGLH